jgi:putative ABC transport system permease protein
VISTLFADLRYGARLLRQSPVFGAIAVLALALGIGANTAIFSTVDTLILRALPYRNPDQVAIVWEDSSFAGFPKNTPAPGNFYEWKARNHVFTDMAATRGAIANLAADGPPEQVLGRRVTHNFFDVLGTPPLLGRTFTEEEDRTNPYLVLISYSLWQRRYAGDPAIVNRAILMSGVKYTVLGVMPPGFVFMNRDVDYWAPVHFTPQEAGDHGSHYLNVVARLKPGVTIERARSEMNAIASQLQKEFPPNSRVGAVVVPIRDELLGSRRVALWVLMGAAGCVLLIACANLASMLLARAVARQREMAVRIALGAGRGRLVAQMITEGMLLSLIGGVLGLGVARAGMALLTKLAPQGFGAAEPRLNAGLLLFTLGLSILTGVLFSLVPALQTARASLNDALRQGGRAGVGGRRASTRDALIVLEVAMALVLLTGAGLMLKTMAKLHAIDIGFRPDHMLTLRTTLPREIYREGARRVAFFDRVVEGVRGLPGVTDAAYGSQLPFQSNGNTQSYRVEGRDFERGEATDALLRCGTNDYLKALRVQLVEGRLPDDHDTSTSMPVIVVNDTLARRWWPHESALGHRIAMAGRVPVWRTIIGVVKDVRERGYEPELKSGVYIPYVQFPDTWAVPESLVVRTTGDPVALTSAVRRIIAGVDPQQPVVAVRTMEETLNRTVEDRTQQMTLLGAFAGLALLLASIGIYGVLSYLVTQRRREIGVRMALGATSSTVVGMVLRRGLALTGTGLAVGFVAAVLGTRAMKTMLYGVDAIDPATFAGVAAVLCAIAALACWVPAMRAARVDPIVVLRDE